MNYDNEDEIFNIFVNYDISKLDINRIYRFIDKYTNYESSVTEDNESIEE